MHNIKDIVHKIRVALHIFKKREVVQVEKTDLEIGVRVEIENIRMESLHYWKKHPIIIGGEEVYLTDREEELIKIATVQIIEQFDIDNLKNLFINENTIDVGIVEKTISDTKYKKEK